jgi:hypothetical protein
MQLHGAERQNDDFNYVSGALLHVVTIAAQPTKY